MPSRLEYALSFAQAGFYLFPCANDKRPCVKDWENEATKDQVQIRSWAVQFPNCRWGCAVGRTNTFVLDVDSKPDKDGRASLSILKHDKGDLPDTFTVKTLNGGLHYYFQGPGATSAGKLGKGLDTRGAGGYVVIPDGEQYTITTQAPLAQAPVWLVEMAGKPSRERDAEADKPAPGVELDRAERITQAVTYAAKQAPGAPTGQRDITAYQVACAIRDIGLSYDVALHIMLHHWADRKDVELGPDFDHSHITWKVGQAYRTAQNRLGATLPEAAFAGIEPAAGSFMAHDAGDIDIGRIPKREWLLGTWFLKQFVTVTVAPGGTGKSNLSVLEGLALVTGYELTGEHVHETGNVWWHNGEDPRHEMERRIAAACLYNRIDFTTIRGKFFYTSGRDNPIVLVRGGMRSTFVKDQSAIDNVKRHIIENDIKLWIVDPFIDMHDCPENDNSSINAVAKVLAHIADETGCAVHVVHHTRKKGKDGDMADMDAARGASALLSAARIGRNLNTMCDKDAEKYILPKDASWYTYLTSSKANLSGPSETTRCLEKVSVELPNGDSVGTMRPIDLDDMKAEDIQLLRQAVVNMVEENGGSIGVNEVGIKIEEGGEFDIKRSGMTRKLRFKIFPKPYMAPDGKVYSVVKSRVGTKSVWCVERQK